MTLSSLLSLQNRTLTFEVHSFLCKVFLICLFCQTFCGLRDVELLACGVTLEGLEGKAVCLSSPVHSRPMTTG